MGLNFLVKLSDNDKSIIIALLLLIILVFVLCGFFGSLIIRTMKWQAKKCDALIHEVVVNRIVTTPRQLRVYARKKNRRCFIKQAWIPLVMIISGVLLIVLHNAIFHNWSYNPFNKDDGFSTLLFVWDFGNKDCYTKVFFLTLLKEWPPLINTPHFVPEALFSYFAIPALLVGGVWYIVAAQSYLARTIRAIRLSKSVFSSNLENFNMNSTPPIQQQAGVPAANTASTTTNTAPQEKPQ